MPNKIIIDTDPGVDDIMALLLALSAPPQDLEVLLISVTYGNVPLRSCLKNVVALFRVLESELAWRGASGKAEGFEALRRHKPIVAVGPEHPLEDEELAADFFHGADGLHNVHETYPHLPPEDAWADAFSGKDENPSTLDDLSAFFTPSTTPAHLEILRILKENPPDTVTILTVGPLTNMAMAAAAEPETFLRVKELLVMGGAVHCEGNCTPVAEFNCYADPVAAARVYALTSPNPLSTMPSFPEKLSALGAYPTNLSRRLNLVLFPLDITNPHLLDRQYFADVVNPYIEAGSPLARWIAHFINGAFGKLDTLDPHGMPSTGLCLNDPLTVWYAMTRDDPSWKSAPAYEDIRIETVGEWTRGMQVIDRRNVKRPVHREVPSEGLAVSMTDNMPGDDHGWMNTTRGNRIRRIVATPGESGFQTVLMKQIFG